MSMYNKLFTKILDSSIWLAPTPTRIVWLMFIAMMDEDGFVQIASVANVAHRARISEDEACNAIVTLESPDENSSDPENEGRRIEKVPGGWMVLNAGKYRELVTRQIIKAQTRERVKNHRNKKKCNAPVTQGNENVTPSDSYSDSKEVNTDTASPSVLEVVKKGKDWNPTPLQTFLSEMFKRRPTTKFSARELKAYRDCEAEITPDDDIQLLDDYYDSGNKYLRKELITLLNNWNGEIDKARAWKSEVPAQPRLSHTIL